MNFEIICRFVSRLLTAAVLLGLLFMAESTTAQAIDAARVWQNAVRYNALALRDAWYGGPDNIGQRLANAVVHAASAPNPCKPRKQRRLIAAVYALTEYTGSPYHYPPGSEGAMVSTFSFAALHAAMHLTETVC